MKGKACFQGETSLWESVSWVSGLLAGPLAQIPRGHSSHGAPGRAGRPERPRRAPSPRVGLTVEGEGPLSCWEGQLMSRSANAVVASTGSPCTIDTRFTHMGPLRGLHGPPWKAREDCL